MEQMEHKYWNVLDHISINTRTKFLTMMEEYLSQIPKGDEILLREHYLPITKIIMRMRTTLSGIAKTDAQVLEDAVRERCVDVPEKRIKRIISILDKILKYSGPRVFEMLTHRKSGRLQSGICVPGSNCHYTKEFMMHWISLFSKEGRPRKREGYICFDVNVHTYDHLSATKVISPIDLRNYTQMKIVELVPGIVNTNKVIYCTLLIDAYTFGSFHTAVEDDFGQCAKLSICNATPELQDTLKKGVRIAIANPYYKLGLDDCYFIRMDSSEEIIVIIYNETYNQEDSNLNQSSEDCKLEGNKYFKAGEYSKAVSCYTIAIAKDSSNPVYLSNRALCYLKLDSFEDALQDAEAAVSLDPSTHKYQYRLAMAWSALGDHQKSVEILETMQANSECLAFLSREKKLLNNSRGIFNFDEMAQKARRGEELEIADFIGPIIIDKSRKHGHGVFATRDIKKGELICVQKAIVYLDPAKRDLLKDQDEIIYFADHVSFIFTRARMNKCLAQKIAISKLSAFRLFTLYTKHLNSEPISIELYSSKGYQCIRDKEKPVYQMQQIITIIQKNSFAYPHPADPRNFEMHTHGLWLIRAFFNHSCLPNSSLTFYRDVCVVHANVKIPKGTELTAPRISNAQLSFEEHRNILLSKWDYICDCELCEFESDPRNKNALARAILLRERADEQTEESYYSEYPATQDFHFKLLEQAFSLAEEMKLGPTRFNTAVWQAIHFLISPIPEPKDHEKFLRVLNRAKSILCDYELRHQLALWKRWKSFHETCQAPLPDACETEVEENFKLLSSYRSNVPANITK